MKNFSFYFKGRQSGAIGITYQIKDTYKAKDIHEALSYLYEDYELISGLAIRSNNKIVERPSVIEWVKVRSNRERPRNPKDSASYILN